jgi:hypothetical protein
VKVKNKYRCGWCGAPTHADGSVLDMSKVELESHIEKNWKDAGLVNGHCCMEEYYLKEEEEFYNRMRLEQ